jgi:hypothetical protein
LCIIRLPLSKNVKISTTKRHNSTPTLLKTQYKKCLPSKPRLLFRSLPPRKRKNVKRKPRECSRVSLPRWISNYISFRCLFLSDLDDGWNFGRYPRKNLLFEKRESKSTSRLKTSELNRQIKIYTSTSTEFMSSKSRCRSRRPQTCANSRHQGDENLFFFISCFLPQTLVSAPKDTQN